MSMMQPRLKGKFCFTLTSVQLLHGCSRGGCAIPSVCIARKAGCIAGGITGSAFQRNLGFRIDHILVTPPLAARCTTVTLERELRKLPKPSDHIPVVATFSET